MSYIKLIACRIAYFLGFNFAIAASLGYEDSLINPGDTGFGVCLFLTILFGALGGLALRRNIQVSGLDRYEMFTVFASVVFAIGVFVIES